MTAEVNRRLPTRQEAKLDSPLPIMRQQNIGMPDPAAARAYLGEFLTQRGIKKKAASLALGHSHAYLQQYISRGKPLWLDEVDRNALIALYGLDGEKLAPPPLNIEASRSSGQGEKQTQVQPPRAGKFVDDPRLLEIIDIWLSLPDGMRGTAMTVLRSLRARGIESVG